MGKKKRRDGEGDMTSVAALDLGDSGSLTTVLSPAGDVVESFPMTLDEEGYTLFAGKVPKDARVAIEATTTAYAVTRRLKAI